MRCRSFFLTLFGLISLLSTGCVKKIAVNSVASALSGDGNSTVFTGDNDPELVGDALPFALKMYESILAQAPDHDALHVSTGTAFITYAFAWVAEPASRLPDTRLEEKKKELKRAKNLYLRGRNYLFDALEIRYPGFSGQLKSGPADSALARTVPADSTALYWLGMGWMGAITTDKFDLGLMFGMKKAVACIERVAEFNPAYGDGAVDEFFLSYYGGLPPSMGGSEVKARAHFKKAIELSGGTKAGPYIALATTVSVKNQDLAEFTGLLNRALEVPTREETGNRLTNIIYQEKARWLLDHTDRFFVLPETEGDNP